MQDTIAVKQAQMASNWKVKPAKSAWHHQLSKSKPELVAAYSPRVPVQPGNHLQEAICWAYGDGDCHGEPSWVAMIGITTTAIIRTAQHATPQYPH